MEKEVLVPVAELRINNRKYPLYEGVNTIGRNRQAVVNIANLNISQNHSVIITLEGKHYISDLKSSNGTFLNDSKLVPLKLYPLANNSTLTFGTLSGSFVSDGEFSRDVLQSQTSFITQSFFEKNTQLLDSDSTQNLDIHDAPTQEFSWSNAKSTGKAKLPPVPKTVFEEPVNNQSNIEENGTSVNKEEDHCINGTENVPAGAKIEIVSQSNLEVEQVDNEVAIEEAHSPILDFNTEDNDLSDSVYSAIGVGPEEKTEDRVNLSDDDLTDCEEDPFKHITAEESDVGGQTNTKPSEKLERPSCPVFANVSDDDLTDCEEDTLNCKVGSPPKENIKNNLSENTTTAVSEANVLPTNTSPGHQNVENNIDDADLTDCEEDTSNCKVSRLPKEDIKINLSENTTTAVSEASLLPTNTSPVHQDVENNIDDGDLTDCEEPNTVTSKPNATTVPTNTSVLFKNDDDDLTDCEDDCKPQPSTSTAKPSNMSVKEDSNDSVKFVIETTSGDIEINEGNSDSEDSDSIIGVPNTTKKSAMVISTQDAPDTADNTQSNSSSDEVVSSRVSRKSFMVISTQDFTESGSDTQVYDTSTKDYTDCDISIPATQDVSGIDLDETDCIPATQVAVNQRSQSTQGSFKLGLTQMMIEEGNPNQAVSEVIISKEADVNKDIDDSFLASTQKLAGETKKNQGGTEFYDAPTQKMSFVDKEDDDMFCAPTQKVSFPSRKSISNEQDDSDLFMAPTQKITGSSVDKEEDEMFCAPTQKASFSSRKSISNEQEDSDLLMAPTQKIADSFVDKEEDEMFCAPTQKVSFSSRKSMSSEQNDSNLFMAPTQKVVGLSTTMTQDSLFLAPTQKFGDTKDDSAYHKDSQTDVYDAPTQKVVTETPLAEDFFFAPTQKVNLEATSEKLPDLSSIREEEGVLTNHVDTKMTKSEEVKKKVFTFKKVACNLEVSLSEIIGITPVKCSKASDSATNSLQTVDSSCMELTAETTKDRIESCKDLPDQKVSGKNLVVAPSESKTEESVDKVKDFETALTDAKLSKKEHKEQSTKKVENDTSVSKSSVKIEKAARELKANVSQDSSSTKTEPVDTKPAEQHAANNESSISVTSEMNQSIAILEAKFHKTRRTKNVSKIDLSVPKKRSSMELSVIDNGIEADPVVKPKRGRKAAETTYLEPAKPKARKTSKVMKESSSEDPKPSTSGRQKKTQEVAPSKRGRRKPSESLSESDVNSVSTTQSTKSLDSINEAEVTPASDKLNHDRVEEAEPVKSRKTTNELENTAKQTNLTTSRRTRGESSKSIEAHSGKPSRTVGKRKKVESVESENEMGIERLSSLKRQKTQLDQTALGTPQRGRRQKPKVVFTMMESPQLESLIKTMGGSIVDSIKTCSVLITEHVKRSQKLLSAIGLGIPICSPKWVTDSKKQHDFLDPWDYILTDPEAEDKWQFSLKESLKRSKDKKLFADFTFNIQVTNGADVLKGAIESCGGKCITKIPSAPPENLYIISSLENKSKYSRVIKKHPHVTVIEPEAVFDGVLRQELRFQRHILS